MELHEFPDIIVHKNMKNQYKSIQILLLLSVDLSSQRHITGQLQYIHLSHLI